MVGMAKRKKISTEPYRGVRDFYPEDMRLLNYLFGKMRETVEGFGYVEYGASILEPAELYRAKTGEEIVNEQTYTFKDRGEREVTLRPEMTPTVARMIAARKRDLGSPLRWYSIPNLFRYERTQRGRLREHFQLNVDLFGVESEEVEVEIITVAYKLIKNLGAKDKDFEIRVNDRRINDALYDKFGLSPEQKEKISKLIDKRNKIPERNFNDALEEIIGNNSKAFTSIIDSNKKLVENLGEESQEVKRLVRLIERLNKNGIKNLRFDQNLIRGFDYYTGFVFEIFDTDPENKRSLFGGGRYDNLLEIFGQEKMPAVGFGAGDVTILDFLKTHNLLPALKNSIDLYICRVEKELGDQINEIADGLREKGLNIAVDLTQRKIVDQIKLASKQKIPYIICIGENEVKSKKYKVKNLESGEEKELAEEELVNFLKK